MRLYVGTTFIEILISLLLLSFLLLSFDATQFTALKATKTAYFFSAATQQLSNITARLTASKGQQLQEHLRKWNQENQQLLPQGFGKIKNEHPLYRIDIFWGKQSHTACNKNNIGLSGCLRLTITLPKATSY